MLFNDFVFKPQVFFYHKMRRKRDWTISDGGANRNVYFFLKQDEKANNFGIHHRISGSQFLRKWIYLVRQVLFNDGITCLLEMRFSCFQWQLF